MKHRYSGTSNAKRYVQGSIGAPNKPSVLLDNSGRIFGKPRPQYTDYAASQFVSVRSEGAKVLLNL
jgi:glucan 1,3-beta-glucosidase